MVIILRYTDLLFQLSALRQVFCRGEGRFCCHGPSSFCRSSCDDRVGWHGVESTAVDSEPNIRNKLSRGKFTAVFLIQCLEAIGATELRI
ncbi:DUF6471 domain-containing protein [Sphingobium sp. R-7]|uniref:DUF6471 domain-containing protein n=1 Tax=Sphingobium sp. R-7 TaxID=3375449 RepID=UPI00398A8ECE